MAGAALVALSRDRYFRQGRAAGAGCGAVRRRARVRCRRHRGRRGQAQRAPSSAPRVRAPRPGGRSRRRHGGRRPLVRRPGRPARRARRGGWSAPASFGKTPCAPAGSRPTASSPASPSCPDHVVSLGPPVTGVRLPGSAASCRSALGSSCRFASPLHGGQHTRARRRARPPRHLRSRGARIRRARRQRAPHPDPAPPPSAGSCCSAPASRSTRRASPSRSGISGRSASSGGWSSTRSGPTPAWSRGSSPRTAGAPRPTGGSAARAARWPSRSAWSRTTCSARLRPRRCGTARPRTARS